MLKRRGFTLIELMLGIVMLGLVGLMMARLMTSMLRVTTAQIQVAGAQGASRMGVSAIPLEFREIGFDTLPAAGTTDTDLEAIAANRITFRAMRGTGFTCDIAGWPNEIKVRKPIIGMRNPIADSDTFRIFIDNDVNMGTDDQWVTLVVTDMNAGNCGPDQAFVLTINAPVYDNGDGIPITQVWVGGPVRWYEEMEYGPVIDATTGRTYVGGRSLNQGENTLEPMIGPIPDSTGFSLVYYGGDGTVLDPTDATNRIKVRSIGITLTGTTTSPVSLAGSSTRARNTSPVFTRVALRNNLRENAP